MCVGNSELGQAQVSLLVPGLFRCPRLGCVVRNKLGQQWSHVAREGRCKVLIQHMAKKGIEDFGEGLIGLSLCGYQFC